MGRPSSGPQGETEREAREGKRRRTLTELLYECVSLHSSSKFHRGLWTAWQ